MFILIFINPQYTVLHILSHCTFYSLFYYLFLFSFLFSPIFIYIYILSCYVSLFCFFCIVHWADLSWLTFHYWLYPVWLCTWRIIKNLDPLENVLMGWFGTREIFFITIIPDLPFSPIFWPICSLYAWEKSRERLSQTQKRFLPTGYLALLPDSQSLIPADHLRHAVF